MVKWKTVIVFAILLGVILFSLWRFQGQSLSYEPVYSLVVGFGSHGDYNREKIPKDVYLFNDISKWTEFKKKYLWSLNIPDPIGDKKYVVIQQIYSSRDAHVVKDIRMKDNTIIVYVKNVRGGGGIIDGFMPDNYYRDIIIVSLDGKKISANKQVILKSTLL